MTQLKLQGKLTDPKVFGTILMSRFGIFKGAAEEYVKTIRFKRTKKVKNNSK